MERDPLEVVVDNGSDVTHQPYVAYNQGFDAFDKGYTSSFNPYPDGSIEEIWWNMGFEDAFDQEQEEEDEW